MKTAVRVIAILFAVVLLLFGLLAAYLMFLFDPNDYRERISSEVEKHTGRALVIQGDIGLSVFPWIGVEIGRSELGNAAGFGDASFARVEQVEVRARLMPLLRSEVEVDRVVLRGLALDLERRADGRTNWDDLAARGKGAPADRTPGPSSPGDAMGGIAAIVVAGVEVEDARVSFRDAQAGADYVVERLSLKTGEVRAGERFPLELGFDVAISEPEVAGRVTLEGDVRFDLAGPRVDVTAFRLGFEGKGEGLPGGRADVSLAADLALDLGVGTAAVDKLVLRGYEVEARGQLGATGLTASPSFEGRFEVPELDPRKVMAAMAIPVPATADDKVLRTASLTMRVDGSANALNVRDFVAVLDESRLAGELSVPDLAKQALRFDLALNHINVDRYVAPPEDDARAREVRGAREGAPPEPGAEAAVAVLDPAVLRGLDVIGKFTAGRVVARGLTITDIAVEVRAQGGVLRLEPLAARMYDGSYAGNATFDARADTLSMSLGNKLTGVQIGTLLGDLAGAEQRLIGTGHVDSKLQARGNDVDAIKRSLAGNVDFRFLDGAVRGINVAQFLRQAQARLSGRPAPAADEPNQTDFTEFSGSVQIRDGIARNEDLDMRSPLLRVGGKGSVNLPEETVDYVVRASVVASLAGQGGEGLDNLRGVTLPIRISGALADPSIRPDIESLLTDRVKQEAQKRLEGAVQDKVAPELQEGLKKGLGDFLQRR